MAEVQHIGGAGKYKIGLVAQLTGLTTDTIRAWERRYASVEPVRTPNGTRLYTDDDVTRLQLMHALTESGDQIGSIAELTTESLRERLGDLAGLAAPPRSEDTAPRRLRLAVVDPQPGETANLSVAELGAVELVCAVADVKALEAAGVEADAVVVHLSALGKDPAERLRRAREATGAELTLVLYDYARRRELARLAATGARLVRGPVPLPSLVRTLHDLRTIARVDADRTTPVPPELRRLDASGNGAPPERRYSDEQIARLREIQSAVDCECPNHLASIITSLVAFEAYSADCEDRDEADAELHAQLGRSTAGARAVMEDLLARVCDHDGIRI